MSTDIKNTIAQVLNLDNSNNWKVTDSDSENSLYMINHVSDADPNMYGNIRGVVVDMESEKMVCQAFPYTHTVVTPSVYPQEDGNYHFMDEGGVEHVLSVERTVFKYGFEGTFIHIFKHKGKVYRCTRKRLNITKSRWGNSSFFEDIYWELGGPKDDDLFDPEKENSPFCHSFIMVHPDLLLATKRNVGKGFLVYVGAKVMGEPKDETFEKTPRQIRTQTYNFEALEELVPVHLNLLPLEEVNHQLTFGNFISSETDWIDPRLLPGEFVIAEEYFPDGSVHFLRLESPGYQWRKNMRDNDPNLRHRFYQLLNGAYLDYRSQEGREKYLEMFPLLTQYNQDSLLENIQKFPMVMWPQNPEVPITNEMMRTRESRLYNIWQCFLLSVPNHRQEEVIFFLVELMNKRKELIGWFYDLEQEYETLKTVEKKSKSKEVKEEVGEDEVRFSRRVVNIVTTARRLARQKQQRGQDTDRRGKKQSYRQLTRGIMRNFLHKEEGTSLYRLVREMDRYMNDQREKEELENQVLEEAVLTSMAEEEAREDVEE
jgi:hypothetical protein